MTRTDLARKDGLLIDTNLLVLYIIGHYDPKRITSDKRTHTYTPEDFDLLINFMGLFRRFITTPNILTEVSNLLEGVAYQYGPVLAIVPDLVKNFIEIHQPGHSPMTSRTKEFVESGLSDTVSCSLIEPNYLVLTDDFRLGYYLQNKGFDAVNINNIRSGYFLS